MVTPRRGIGKLGCLVSLALVVVIGYFAVDFGEVFMRYYRYRDAMQQEARFFERSDDDGIRRRLAAFADSLGLPEEASRVGVTRSAEGIEISAEWRERVELKYFSRELHFAPRVEQSR